jgi:hypothetical protein
MSDLLTGEFVMKCKSCGGDLAPDVSFCSYCGTAVERPAVTAGPPGKADVFAAIKQSREYAQRESPTRLHALPRFGALQKVFPFVFAGCFLGVSCLIFVMFLVVGSSFRNGVACMAVVPLAFVALGIYLFFHFAFKMKRYQAAPLLARPAIIVGKRTQVSGGSGDSSATTTYYLTAEFENGDRREFTPIRQDLYGRLAEGDAGVLFTKSDVLLALDLVRT